MLKKKFSFSNKVIFFWCADIPIPDCAGVFLQSFPLCQGSDLWRTSWDRSRLQGVLAETSGSFSAKVCHSEYNSSNNDNAVIVKKCVKCVWGYCFWFVCPGPACWIRIQIQILEIDALFCLESALYSVYVCGVQAPLLPGECLIFSIYLWCAGTPPAWRVPYIQYLCVVCRHPTCLESA